MSRRECAAAQVRCGRVVDPDATYPHPCVLPEGHDGPCDPRPPEMRSAASTSRIPADQPQTWYFTFGVGQPRAGKFYRVEDATFSEARQRMVDVFGTTWAFQYDEVDWHKNGVSQEEKWNLTQIK